MFYVRYVGENGGISLEKGNVYCVVGKEPLDEDLVRIIDETECDYLFSLSNFKMLKDEEINDLEKKKAENLVKKCNEHIVTYGHGNF